MDFFTTLAVVIPSSLSLLVSGIYACIALKKAKSRQKMKYGKPLLECFVLMTYPLMMQMNSLICICS